MSRSSNGTYNYKELLLKGIEQREKRRIGFRIFFDDFYAMVQNWKKDRKTKK